MRLRVIGLSLALTTVACDPDGDGLTTAQEKQIGADPQVADSDADGLDDLGEWNWGTDPMSADSDGDGYDDGDEVCFGSDPLDQASKIYKGGWPYNCDKDAWGGDDWSNEATKNAQVPRIDLRDQFGDRVDIYDYAFHDGKPVVIDISAGWCPPCQDLAAYIEGENNWVADIAPSLPDLVNNGDIYWLTILGENAQGGEADKTAAAAWADDFPNDHIPVLADKDQELVSWVSLYAWPTIMVLHEDMTIQFYDNQDPWFALEKLEKNYGY